MDPVIVKLGGSVITRKSEESTLRPKVLTRLAQELLSGWSSAGRPPMVVVHGAGSFGHPWAKKWALNAPPPGPRGQRGRGVAVTSYQVRVLHNRVLKALLESGIPALSLPPSSVGTNHEGKLERLDLGPVRDATTHGMVPVTMGDVVPDSAWEFSILSGDTLMLELARALHPGRAIFVSDVDGLLDPTNHRKVMPKITEANVRSLSPTGKVDDVTGGIVGKARCMLEIGHLGVRTGLVNGLREGVLESALGGSERSGSWT